MAVVRLVLIGGDGLDATLGQHSARGLASRIVARIDVPSAADRETAADSHPMRAQKLIVYYAAPAVLTAAIVLVGLPALVEHHLLPPPEASRLALAHVAGLPAIPPTVSPTPASNAPQVSPAAFSTPIDAALPAVTLENSPTDGSPTAPSAWVVPEEMLPLPASLPVLAKGTPVQKPAAPVASAIPLPKPSSIVLQVASFRNKRNALSLRDRLAAQFRDVYIMDVDVAGTTYHRVRIGSFRDDAAAAAAQTVLRENGFHAMPVLSVHAGVGSTPDSP
jgi:cell division septation protein DedD